MPSYSYQPQFVEPIRRGTKGGTIRATRRYPPRWSDETRLRYPGGHAGPGMLMSMWVGLRSRHPVAICQRTCCAVEPITLDFKACTVDLHHSLILLSSRELLDRFAVFDGFADFDEMRAFWSATDSFDGWHVRWLELPQ